MLRIIHWAIGRWFIVFLSRSVRAAPLSGQRLTTAGECSQGHKDEENGGDDSDDDNGATMESVGLGFQEQIARLPAVRSGAIPQPEAEGVARQMVFHFDALFRVLKPADRHKSVSALCKAWRVPEHGELVQVLERLAVRVLPTFPRASRLKSPAASMRSLASMRSPMPRDSANALRGMPQDVS